MSKIACTTSHTQLAEVIGLTLELELELELLELSFPQPINITSLFRFSIAYALLKKETGLKEQRALIID
ncbi:hypothetical protein RST01_09860 [Rummeliibacillus stabekisii]|nr:hypothetical protein RST01_09860 [Rummeliibacillus stabekisii]